MKKYLLLILTFSYFASTTGATVYLHYCMGKMVEWNIVGNEKDSCPGCGMDKSKKSSKDCCNDEHKQLKVVTDHSITETALKGLHLTTLALPVSYIDITAIAFSSIAEENPTSNAPPESNGIALYKRNCVFRS